MPRARILAPVAVAALVAVLAGCSAALTDTTTSAELAADSKGAFAMLVEFPDETCNNMMVHLGKEEGGAYEIITSIPMQSTVAGHKGFIWSKPAGTYHVIGAFCGKSLTEGKEIGFAKLQPKAKVSFASFEVKSGEFINLGRLIVRGSPGKRSIVVGDLPPEEIALLAERAPKSTAAMVKRPMKFDIKRTNAEEAEAERIVAALPKTTTTFISVPVYHRR